MEEQKITIQTNQNKKERAITHSFFFWLLSFFVLVLIDQAAKLLFFKNPGGFRNYFFAFSLPVPAVLMYLIYAAALGAIICYLSKSYKTLAALTKFAWTLIVVGAVANIAERIILGYVRDFIYINFFHWTGIYNLADFFIIAGIILLLIPEKTKIV